MSRGDRGVGGDTCGDGVDGAGSSKVSGGGSGAGSTLGNGRVRVIGKAGLLFAKPLCLASFATLLLGRVSSRRPCAGAVVGVGARPGTSLLRLSFLKASTATPLNVVIVAGSLLPILCSFNAPALTLTPVSIGSYLVASPNP